MLGLSRMKGLPLIVVLWIFVTYLMGLIVSSEPLKEEGRLMWVLALGTAPFIVVTFIFLQIKNYSFRQFFGYTPFSLKTLLYTFLLWCTAYIPMTYSIKLNGQITLPDGLIELSRQLEEVTLQILSLNDLTSQILAVAIVGVLAAVGEEFFFRGLIQRHLFTWIKSHHLAILITGVIFSIFHFDLLNFLPRLMMGVVLGYIFWYTKSLLYPILIHFLNNTIMLLLAFLGDPEEILNVEKQIEVIPWLLVMAISGVGGLIYLIYKKHKTASDSFFSKPKPILEESPL